MGESWNRSDIDTGEFKSCARDAGVGLNSSAAVNRPSIRLNVSFMYRTAITHLLSGPKYRNWREPPPQLEMFLP